MSAPPAYHLSPEKLSQAVSLSRDRHWLHFGAEAWSLIVLLLLLTTGTASRLGQLAAEISERGWLQAMIFSVLLVVVLFVVGDLPASAIGHALSLKYGISIQGWASWLLDQVKIMALTLLLEAPLLMLVFGLLHWSPRRYWLWFAGGTAPMILVGTFLLPSVIEPMFDKFEPLAQSHPALVSDLQRVVARTGTSIPAERMFLMKASEKSNGLNAYVTGLGSSKRIVVWDTTADRIPQDEILFIFAHESGHYVLNHIVKGLIGGIIGIFLLFWITSKLAALLTRRFGKAWHMSKLASLPGLVVLLFVLTGLQILTEPIDSCVSRFFEHEADVYGQEAIHGIVPDPQGTTVSAFNHLGEAYLDEPDPNPFIEFWSYDHPSTQHRATFAAGYDPWEVGNPPRFFAK